MNYELDNTVRSIRAVKNRNIIVKNKIPFGLRNEIPFGLKYEIPFGKIWAFHHRIPQGKIRNIRYQKIRQEIPFGEI